METVYQDGNAGGESATLGYLYRQVIAPVINHCHPVVLRFRAVS